MIVIDLPENADGLIVGPEIWDKLKLSGTLHMEKHRLILDPEQNIRPDRIKKAIPKKIRDKCQIKESIQA